jgi:hypothetical protein
MKLSECKIGEIVMLTSTTDVYNKYPIGHIVGLSRAFFTNMAKRKTDYNVTILVLFAGDEDPLPIEPENLQIPD